MKKIFTIKPFIIAAAISATAVASLVTANAATDGAIADGISKTFTFIFKGQPVTAEYTSYVDNDGNEFEQYVLDIPEGDDSTYGFTIINEEGADGQLDSEVKYFNIDEENFKITEADAPEDIEIVPNTDSNA